MVVLAQAAGTASSSLPSATVRGRRSHHAARSSPPPQVGFALRLEGCRLAATLEEALPDYALAFEGRGSPEARALPWQQRRPPAALSLLSHTPSTDPAAHPGPPVCPQLLVYPAPPPPQEPLGFYYRCDATRQLDARYGDLQHRIQAWAQGGQAAWRHCCCGSASLGCRPPRKSTTCAAGCPLGRRGCCCASAPAPTSLLASPLPCPPRACRQDLEASIACQLTQRLSEFRAEIGRAAAAAAELDCILSLADAARDLRLCRPQVRGGRCCC